MAKLLPYPRFRAFDSSGDPLAGGKVYTYEAGTTTPKTSYTNSLETVANTNPVILDSQGYGDIWITGTYKIVITDANDVVISTTDNIQNDAGATGAAGTFQMATAAGSADAIEATYSPAVTLANLTTVGFVATAANATTTPTFAPDGLTARTITKKGGSPLDIGDIPGANAVCILEYNSANTRWELLNPAYTGPFADSLAIVKGSSDATKQARFEVDGLTTGTTRVVTLPDSDISVDHMGSGAVIQSVSSSYTTYSSYTAQIPADNTIPQNTEGTEVTTVTITPKYSTSKLRIRFSGFATASAGGVSAVAAIFRDSTANAVGATISTINTNYADTVKGEFIVDASSTSATTFKLRVGPDSANTIYINGSSSARVFGGVAAWLLTVEELKA